MPFPDYAVVVDGFDRANEGPPPSASWEDAHDHVIYDVVSNLARYNKPASKTFGGDLYATVYSGIIEVFVTIVTSGTHTSSSPGVLLRCTTPGSTTLDGYLAQWKRAVTTNLELYRSDNGVFTLLAESTVTFANGYKIGLVHDPGTGALTIYYDSGSGWTAGPSTTDLTYVGSGQCGTWGYDDTNTQIITLDDFGAGDDSGGGGISLPPFRVGMPQAILVR